MANIYQSIIDNPLVSDAVRRRAMLAYGRDTQGMNTAQAAQQADQFLAQNPQDNPALRQTQQDAFLYNYLGGAPKINQAISNTPTTANPDIMGIQGMSATVGNNTLSDLNTRITRANGGIQPQGTVSATGPGSVTSIPVQRMGEFKGMNTNAIQGGLLGSQPTTNQGLLSGGDGMRPLFPMYGEPEQFRRHGTYGPAARPWMQPNQGVFTEIDSYLRSQQNPEALAAPASLKSFDDWRQGILAKPELAVDAEKIAQEFIDSEIQRLRQRVPVEDQFGSGYDGPEGN